MRVCICCFAAVLIFAGAGQRLLSAQRAGTPAAPPATPLTDDDKSNELSEQVGKLMVK